MAEQTTGRTREDLLTDKRFLRDARVFLKERTGSYYAKPEEVLDNFLEQRRFANVGNEVTILRDLEYAQDASDASKERFARLLDDYEAYDDDFDLKAAGDYAQGLLSPLNIGLGLVSGGVGTLTKVGVQTGGKAAATAALRAALKPTVTRGAIRGATLESGIAAGLEETTQQTREAVGKERQEGMVAAAAIGGGIFGGAFGGVAGKIGASRAGKAGELLESSNAAQATQRAEQKQAVQEAKERAKTAATDALNVQKGATKETKETLLKLDETLVKQGEELFEELNQNDKLTTRLAQETIEAVAISFADIASRFERKQGERITETVARAIKEDKISKEAFQEILTTYKITPQQFSAGYMADISAAAKKLATQSHIARNIKSGKMKELSEQLEAATSRGFIDATKEEIEEVVKEPHKVAEILKSLDRLRLGMMTSQLATTARNTAGGGFRVLIDTFEAGVDNVIAKMTGKPTAPLFQDTFATAKFMFQQEEARVIQNIFEETMPQSAKRLFFNAADAEAKQTTDNILAKVGHGVNFLNTVSDNVFKRAVFSSSLDRQLMSKYKMGVKDFVREGRFGEIDEDIIKRAMDDALEFTYQKVPSPDTMAGEVGKTIIDLHRSAPFLISSFMPFPRFLVNQLKFVHEHSIVMPLLTTGMGITKMPEKFAAKSMSGIAMFTAAVQMRASQPDHAKWYQYIEEDGSVVNMAPILGPFAAFMIAADYFVKSRDGVPSAKLTSSAKEMAVALGTPRVAPAAGLFGNIERLAADITDETAQRAMGRFVGDILNTYTMPASMVRDFMAPFDKDMRYVEEMDRLLPPDANGEVSFFDYAIHYARRNWPRAIEEQNRQYSPTAKGGLERTRTYEKQVLGTTTYKPKSALQMEMDRLGLDRRQIIDAYEKDPVRAQLLERIMGGGTPEYEGLVAHLESALYRDEYAKAPEENKPIKLMEMIDRVIDDQGYTDVVTEQMESMLVKSKPLTYSQDSRRNFERLPSYVRKYLEGQWKKSDEYKMLVEGDPSLEGASITEAGAYAWAVESARRIR